MRKIFQQIMAFGLALVLLGATSGVSHIHYCCGACQKYGLETLVDNMCEETHNCVSHEVQAELDEHNQLYVTHEHHEDACSFAFSQLGFESVSPYQGKTLLDFVLPICYLPSFGIEKPLAVFEQHVFNPDPFISTGREKLVLYATLLI